MSILCYSKKAWASCLLGLAVSAVHYSSHHTVKVCSAGYFLYHVSKTLNVGISDFCQAHSVDCFLL